MSTPHNTPDQPLAHKPPEDREIPETIQQLANGEQIEPVWENQLGGLTFCIGSGPEARYVKWARQGSGLDLAAETDRLRWAHPYTSVPTVLDYRSNDHESWLVTAAMNGTSAVADRWKAEPETAVRAIGTQLRRIHDALPAQDCPFDWQPETRLENKRAEIEQGSIDPSAWRDEFRNLSAKDALKIASTPPSIDKLVVCHGDACAPNTLIGEDGQPTGIVDLDTLGVADRWADLAVATWSTNWNYGPGWEHALLDAYGIDPDPERTAYYRLLWEIG